jgi:hypothetical protein
VLIAATTLGAWAVSALAAVPPGRQYRVTIQGENTVTFVPQAQLPPMRVDYKAKVEYIVDTRYGKDKPAPDLAVDDEKPPVEEVSPKKTAPRKGARPKARAKGVDPSAAQISGAVDLALHSSEMTLRHNGQSVVETRITRSRFQGRLQPDTPAMNVGERDAPPRLQEILKGYDVVAASLAIDDDFKVVGRKYRSEGPQRAMIETLLSIHTPIPRGVDSWDSPTQLAMGQGHTAKGTLRFEKDAKASATSSDVVKVKVSGVLKAEGVLAGNLIKDGTYSVNGEQTFDAHTREWTASLWSVVVVNELANQAGLTVAQAKGKMTVESKALDSVKPTPAAASSATVPAAAKP